MSSSEAGPSSARTPAPAKEVLLSVEPVHIYTDPNPSSSAFERERKLQDILPDGTNVFSPPKAASVRLSEDVHRLWAERGDFSRFRTSDLLKKRDRSPSASTSASEDEEGKQEQVEEEEGLLRREGKVGGTIGESEFIELRNKVLGSLDVAHFNSIHAHQLLGMLIKQHRSATSSSNAAAGGGGKAGSPAPSTGAASQRSGGTAKPPSLAPLGIFSHLSPANREEEFILDPLAIALSRTSLNTSSAVRRDLNHEEEDEDEDEDPSSAGYGINQAKKEIEGSAAFKESKLRELKVVLETKRKAISNAAELLSAGAEELRAGHARNRERWRGLIGLHGRGWGLTPGRPLLDVERFDASLPEEEEGEEKKQKKEDKKKGAAGLQGFGTPILTSDGKVKEEGARDAWIGYGLPEAPVELRRRSLAYWADSPESGEVRDKLVFPDRLNRRLRVRFVLWPPTNNGGEGKGKREWSSDAPYIPPKKEGESIAVGQVLDEDLQNASREASDELIFGDVVAQARLLPPAFGVRLTSSSVRIVLTKRLDLVVELVPTTPIEAEEGGGEYSPHATLLLAFLRMGPLRKYASFIKATNLARGVDATARAAALKAKALAKPKKSGSAEKEKPGKGAGMATLSKLDSLGPVLLGVHYWSFVHRLGCLLKEVQGKEGKLRVRLVPITSSSAGLVTMLGGMVDGLGSAERESSLHTIYPPPSSEGALQGWAKIWIDTRLVCTLTFSQPSLLSVQFASPPPSRFRKGVRLTNKPLGVDLDTLRTLLFQQIGLYA